MGLDTGIDMPKLLDARRFLAEGLPGEPVYGFVPDAGVPKNYRRAVDQGRMTLPLSGLRVVEFSTW
jgi:hydroxymethylglutaryl-CoA lyase